MRKITRLLLLSALLSPLALTTTSCGRGYEIELENPSVDWDKPCDCPDSNPGLHGIDEDGYRY